MLQELRESLIKRLVWYKIISGRDRSIGSDGVTAKISFSLGKRYQHVQPQQATLYLGHCRLREADQSHGRQQISCEHSTKEHSPHNRLTLRHLKHSKLVI